MSDFNNDIAIIGMACHYPGAANIAAFWQNLITGVESISRFSDEELLEAGVDPAELADPNYVPAYGWLEGIDQFDAPFFGLTPREAQLLDPQQRLFLMCAWTALEDAAVDPQQEERPIGVFAGAGQPIYYQENILSNQALVDEMGAFQTTISNDKDFMATRISYKLNLKGPSLNVQTACSTSLVAVHLALQSLLSGECDLALAGGSSIVTTGKTGYLYSNEGLFAPDGHCRAFDAEAGGMVGGDGVGAVVLKRLEDAQIEGDTIYAVIKGSAVNNDGANKIGFTAPSVEGQAAAILEAQAVADVLPETITMIEAHGTGTPLGDPIELAGLTAAFRTQTADTNYCAIGSVKTNIGHTNAAAGVAGIIKTALALHHQMIPPSLNFKTPNPEIDFEGSPFYVNTNAKPWTAGTMPRRAGVSSFGLGGTNAHAILEETPAQLPSGPSRPYQLLTLSAKTEKALTTRMKSLAAHMKANPETNLADVAHTLQQGRQRLRFRRTAVHQTVPDAIEWLEDTAEKGIWASAKATSDPPLAFIFPGGGAQYTNMGRELYETEKVFREAIDHCAHLLQADLERDLRDYIYPPLGQTTAAEAALKRPSIGLPALFAISYASAQLWLSWGIQPQALAGHSLGEYAAACIAGVFSLEDALKLVVTRGRLFEQMPAGAMLSVLLPETKVIAYFKQIVTKQPLSIAAINSPDQCVVAGTLEDLTYLETLFEADEVGFRRLAIDVAAHSALVDSILDPFIAFVSQINLSPPTIPLISNVSGDWMTAEEATSSAYWGRHLRQTVRFAAGIKTLLSESQQVILEVGPGRVLTTLIRQNPGTAGRTLLNSLRHPKQTESDVAFLLKTLGQLWQSGITVNWPAFYRFEQRQRLSLPTYPFETQRHWLNPVQQQLIQNNSAVVKKNPNPAEWLYTPSWQRTPSLPNPPIQWLEFPEASLIFSDSHGLATQVVGVLQQAGREVVSVHSGPQFEVIDRHNIVLDLKQPQDFNALINHLKKQNLIPRTILHLWQWGPVEDFGIVDLDQSLNLGFFSLLYLAQALENEHITNQIKLAVITSGMQEVTGLEPLAPERAAVLGPIKVIPTEYEQINTLSIDTSYPASANLPRQLVAELLAPPAAHTEAIIAYRGRFRWQQTFTKVSAANHLQIQPPRLRKQGVYLIIGGLGGIGLALADYLARTVQAKLVLVGRTGLPPRSKWQEESEPTKKEQITAVLNLEAHGAEVMVAAADVTDKGAMSAVFEQAQAQFGPINGIIHSAGLTGGGAIGLKNHAQAMEVLAAKIQGTQIIHTLCPDTVDFVILNSSVASILGGYGQIDYCAANAVLDAYAPYLSHIGQAGASIYWETWQSVGVGITTAADLPPDLLRQRQESLKLGLETEEGQQVFQSVLDTQLSQVVVSTHDFMVRYQFLTNVPQTTQSNNDNLTEADSQLSKTLSASARPSLENEYLAPTNNIEEKIAARWQLLFGIDQIGIQDDFFALGGHSLLATQLLNRLRKDFPNANLSLHDLFSSPTIAGIAELIQTQVNLTPTINDAKPTTSINGDRSNVDNLTLMTTYLHEHLAEALDTETIEAELNLLPLGLKEQAADIIWRLRRDLNLRIYPQELITHPTLASLANHTAEALTYQQNWLTTTKNMSAENDQDYLLPTGLNFKSTSAIPAQDKNPSMVFLLSAPRSGSTLLRLMLGGHPRLFCPPELALLAYHSLSDWQENQQALFTQNGVEQSLTALLNIDERAVQAKLDELAQVKRPIQATYRLLQEAAAPKILLDKTPGYAQHPAILAQAETLFEQPKFIHLIRHPYAAIESFVRHRLHVVLGKPEADSAVLAETVWRTSQQNILDFSQQLGPERYLQVLFEELVSAPTKVMKQICDFLDIPFDSQVLQPYTGERLGERLIAGPGDPDILQHDGIDPELGHIWRKIKLPWPLQQKTQALAAVFGYELPNESTQADLPDELADLSDDEVDALLRQLMED